MGPESFYRLYFWLLFILGMMDIGDFLATLIKQLATQGWR